MASLLDEFEIHSMTKPLFTIAGYPIAFTNSALFMFLSIGACMLLMIMAMQPRAVVPGRWQMLAEKLYNVISDMITSTAGEQAKPFFPFIFTIFTFILFCNLLGLLPGSLAVTSHFIVNLAIALLLFAIIIVTGFVRQGLHFFQIFAPSGVHWTMLIFLVPIEVFSFLVRPLSLSIRLFANMMAGHVLLGVFAGMSVSLFAAAMFLKPLGVLPLFLNVVITAFEFFVAFLQAYIYAILASVYLRDAVEGHA